MFFFALLIPKMFHAWKCTSIQFSAAPVVFFYAASLGQKNHLFPVSFVQSFFIRKGPSWKSHVSQFFLCAITFHLHRYELKISMFLNFPWCNHFPFAQVQAENLIFSPFFLGANHFPFAQVWAKKSHFFSIFLRCNHFPFAQVRAENLNFSQFVSILLNFSQILKINTI